MKSFQRFFDVDRDIHEAKLREMWARVIQDDENRKQDEEIFDKLKEFIQISKDKQIINVIYQISREETDIFKKTMTDSFDNYVERSVLIDLEKNAQDLHPESHKRIVLYN